ncbi:MAG: YceI family protein [Kiloniellales bacterium]|nr:YceI family protein [Kiloniellales bacterium]
MRKTKMTLWRALAVSGGMAAALALGTAAQAANTYTFDKGHTKILFFWNHLGLSNQSARFDDVDGTLVFDSEKPETSKIEVTIKTDSIDSDVPAFDDHLKSADFFNAEKHPEITFVSTAVRKTGSKSGQVEGDLTVNGVTKPVTLDVTFNFQGEHPLSAYSETYKGAQYVAFSARTRVLRSEFNLGLYAPLTSDTVDIMIETELRRVE